jgi:hypothetical protein
MQTRPTYRSAGWLTWLRSLRSPAKASLTALFLIGLSAAPATADPARGTDSACVNEEADAFSDDEGSVHEKSINCMARWNIANGTSTGSYQPHPAVRRDEIASFVVRLMSTAGFAFDPDPADQFDDDDGNVHENSINQLAAAGVVRGTGMRTYAPQQTLTRGQMAALLNRALEAMQLGPSTAHEHFSDDDDSVFEQDIDMLASLGIGQGTGGGLYSPAHSVHRAAMASFLARTADYFAEQNSWPGQLVISDTTPEPGDEFGTVIQGTDYAPNSTVQVLLNGQPFTQANADSGGTFATEFAPERSQCGQTIEVAATGQGSDGSELRKTGMLRVTC